MQGIAGRIPYFMCSYMYVVATNRKTAVDAVLILSILGDVGILLDFEIEITKTFRCIENEESYVMLIDLQQTCVSTSVASTSHRHCLDIRLSPSKKISSVKASMDILLFLEQIYMTHIIPKKRLCLPQNWFFENFKKLTVTKIPILKKIVTRFLWNLLHCEALVENYNFW